MNRIILSCPALKRELTQILTESRADIPRTTDGMFLTECWMGFFKAPWTIRQWSVNLGKNRQKIG